MSRKSRKAWGSLIVTILLFIFLMGIDDEISPSLKIVVTLAAVVFFYRTFFLAGKAMDERNDKYFASSYEPKPQEKNVEPVDVSVNWTKGGPAETVTYCAQPDSEDGGQSLVSDFLKKRDSAQLLNYCSGSCRNVPFRSADVTVTCNRQDEVSTLFKGMIAEFPCSVSTEGIMGGVELRDLLIVPVDFKGNSVKIRRRERRRFAATGDHDFDEQFRCYSTERNPSLNCLPGGMREGVRKISEMYPGRVMFEFREDADGQSPTGRLRIYLRNESRGFDRVHNETPIVPNRRTKHSRDYRKAMRQQERKEWEKTYSSDYFREELKFIPTAIEMLGLGEPDMSEASSGIDEELLAYLAEQEEAKR